MRTGGQYVLVIAIAAGIAAAAAIGFIVLSRRDRSVPRPVPRKAPLVELSPAPVRAERWEAKPVAPAGKREPAPAGSVVEPAPAAGVVSAREKEPAGGRRLVLQGHGAVADTWLTPDEPEDANCDVERANIQVHTPDRTLIRFELPPDVRALRKATLMLYVFWVGKRGGFDISVHRIKAPWKAESATYAKPWRAPGLSSGADYDSTPAASAKAPVPPCWVEFDVTRVVKAWASGEPNHGFLIKAAPWARRGGRYQFWMTDSGRDGPKLVLETE